LSDLTNLPCTSAAFAGLGAEVLSLGKALRFRARGSSMQPLVRDGDCLLVCPVDGCSIRVGDVVFCSSEPGRVVVHRVVRRQSGPDGWRFLVQGDQVRQPDGWILSPQLYGRVTALERAGLDIDLHRPGLRFLGWFAALRSRLRCACSRIFRLSRQLLVFLSGFGIGDYNW
jgi:hypothetical protein